MELDHRYILKNHPKANKENIIKFKDYRFSIITPNLVRIEKGVFLDEATLTFFNRYTKKNDYTYEKKGHKLIVKTDAVTIYFDSKIPFNENYIVFNGKTEKVYFNNDYNLKGTMRTLDTYFDGGFCVDRNITDFRIETLPLKPGIMSKNGLAIVDDKDTPILDKDGLPKERISEEIDSYLFMYDNDYMKALKDFYMVTGNVPLIPRFAFGNWWSRYHQYTDIEYISVLDRFKKEDVPLSVATIDMDWHYVDIMNDFHIKELKRDDENKYGALHGWTGYSWNKKLWPDYKKTLREIKDRGLFITLNLHPRDGIRWFEDMYQTMAKDMGIDPKSLSPVEFDMTDAAFINNYFKDVIHPYENDGVDFWWIDYQQEPYTKIKNVDPLWVLNHYHYLDSKNHLTLSRYAGLGSHRYPLGFSGDTKMIYDFLDFMPYFTFTATNSGYTYWSHDIGAHHYGIKDEDLYLRWIEFGVFSPINRIHSNIMDVLSKEPWLNKSEVRFITDYYLRFRHRLIPYLYHYSHKLTEDNIPLIRPLYYDNPDKEEAYNDKYTYYFGKNIVSPITKKSDNHYNIHSLYLPNGIYYDYFKRRKYVGGRIITILRDIGEIPFLISEKEVLPLQNDVYNFTTYPKDLELNFYSKESSISLNESDNKKLITNVISAKDGENVVITIKSDTKLNFKRNYTIGLRYLNRADVEVYINDQLSGYKTNTAYDLEIILPKVSIKDEIKVILSNINEETFKEYLDKEALNILTSYEGKNTEKEEIYEHIKYEINTKEELISYLESLKDEKLKVALNEISYNASKE